MGLIRKIFWVALTFTFAFFFTILFEYGTVDFMKNSEREWEQLKKLFIEKPQKKKDTSDQIPKK